MASKFITVTEAIAIVAKEGFKASRPTIIKWCREAKIGKQLVLSGDWYIFPDRLEAFLNGEEEIGI